MFVRIFLSAAASQHLWYGHGKLICVHMSAQIFNQTCESSTLFCSFERWTFCSCCHLPCCFVKANVIKINEIGEGVVDTEGFVNSFLMSVGNDTRWLPVLEESTQKCYDQFAGSGTGFFCGGEMKYVLEVWTFFENLQSFRWIFLTLWIACILKTTWDAQLGTLMSYLNALKRCSMSWNVWKAKTSWHDKA